MVSPGPTRPWAPLKTAAATRFSEATAGATRASSGKGAGMERSTHHLCRSSWRRGRPADTGTPVLYLLHAVSAGWRRLEWRHSKSFHDILPVTIAGLGPFDVEGGQSRGGRGRPPHSRKTQSRLLGKRRGWRPAARSKTHCNLLKVRRRPQRPPSGINPRAGSSPPPIALYRFHHYWWAAGPS